MLFCGFVDKDLIFNIVYKDQSTQFAYIKRCQIEKFILEKTYELLPENTTLLAFSMGNPFNIHLKYKPKDRAKIHEQDFALSDFPMRGLKAGGLKLSTREIKTAAFTKAP